MVPITIVNGVYKPSYNWGAPPCMTMVIITMVSQLWVYNYGYFVYHSESETIVIKYIY